ncbi:MAG: hypothetical protein KZQ83_00405 [gamma proteobacterium symbiont of Taylorina sp.]|nr:hypothetical protein [gamma proteobacterium symbiont of Taylorina sp.]
MYKPLFIALLLVFSSSVVFAEVPDLSGMWSGTEFSVETACDEEEEDTITGFYITQEGINFSHISRDSDPDGEFYESIYTGIIDASGVISGTYSYDGRNARGNTYNGSGPLSGNYDSFTGELILNRTTTENSYIFADGSSLPGGCADDGQLNLTRSNTPTKPFILSEVQSTTGTSLSITPVDVAVPTTSGTVPDVTALLTWDDSSTTIKRDDGSIIEVKQKAVVTLNPESSINLIRGEVTVTVGCNYEVKTALANIISCPSNQRSSTSAKFTTNYSPTGIDGKLTVRVETGTLEVIERNGKTSTVTAGNEKIIQNIVPRTSWVLPIDNDKIYGGKNNFFIWTEYPNADSYLLEFNIPGSIFSEENPSSAEFQKQTVVLTSDLYIEYDGLLIFTLLLPKGLDGIVLEVRLFALDKQGNIISETVASDRSTITVTD